MSRFLVLIVGALMINGSVQAAFEDGNSIYAQLTDPKPIQQLAGFAYVSGVADTISTLQDTNHLSRSVCLPTKTPRRQIGDVVRKYLEQNPEQRQHNGAFLVHFALLKRFLAIDERR